MGLRIDTIPESFGKYLKIKQINTAEEAAAAVEELCGVQPAQCENFIKYLNGAGYACYPLSTDFKSRVQKANCQEVATAKNIRNWKPMLEYVLGMSFGFGYYQFASGKDHWGPNISPNLSITWNITDEFSASYTTSYSFAKIDGDSLHSLGHKLGVSYELIHYRRRNDTKEDAFEMNLGGGMLLKNVFVSNDNPASFNIGGYAGVELGVGWGMFDMGSFHEERTCEVPMINTPSLLGTITRRQLYGWTKFYIEAMVSKGDKISDAVILWGGKVSF